MYAIMVGNENKKMERMNRRENKKIPIGMRELRENGKREWKNGHYGNENANISGKKKCNK